MIKVDFKPSELSGQRQAEWESWKQKAKDATDDIIHEWETNKSLTARDFDSEIWSELKAWLLEHFFNKKCAYCETNVKQARQVGHAEHFRPKGGVKYRELDSDVLITARARDEQGQEIDHPGYFWLAYSWRNLVPSCEACNTRQGKLNQFPVRQQHLLVQKLTGDELAELDPDTIASPSWPGFFYLQPEDLDRLEGRLLLHPYYDDPRNDLCFGHGGTVVARELEGGQISDKGTNSIKVYFLDDPDLMTGRHEAQNTAWMRFKLARDYHEDIEGLDPQAALEGARHDMPKFINERTEYRAAAEDYIDLRCTMGF